MGIRDIRHTRYSQILIAAGRQGEVCQRLRRPEGNNSSCPDPPGEGWHLYPGSEIVALHTVETTKGEELVRQVDSWVGKGVD